MSDSWELKALYCGEIRVPKSAITPGLDPDLVFDAPFLAFLLKRPGRAVLIDTGISEKFIVDGKAWGGLPAKGGGDYLVDSLAKAGTAPQDIDTVIFTHLHNDHAGNNALFEKASFVFQKDEWKTLLDPLPAMQIRKDYDLDIAGDLRNLGCTMVDGDLDLGDGLKLFKTPGHTPGSQSIAVQTSKGLRILVGDLWHHYFNGFSQTTSFKDLKGKTHHITPAPGVYGRFIPPSIVYNYFDWYDSSHKIRALAGTAGRKCVVPGHEPCLLREL
jgi:N-acyl homoserine lactone hydrolase